MVAIKIRVIQQGVVTVHVQSSCSVATLINGILCVVPSVLKKSKKPKNPFGPVDFVAPRIGMFYDNDMYVS